MSDPTMLVVGIPFFWNEDDEEPDPKKLYRGKEGSKKLHRFSANNNLEEVKGVPNYCDIYGVQISSTWDYIIEITPKISKKIQEAKKLVKQVTGKTAKVYIIGQQE